MKIYKKPVINKVTRLAFPALSCARCSKCR